MLKDKLKVSILETLRIIMDIGYGISMVKFDIEEDHALSFIGNPWMQATFWDALVELGQITNPRFGPNLAYKAIDFPTPHSSSIFFYSLNTLITPTLCTLPVSLFPHFLLCFFFLHHFDIVF